MNIQIFSSLLYIVGILAASFLAYTSFHRPIEKWAKKAFIMLPIFATIWSGMGFLLIIYEPLLKYEKKLYLTQIKSLSAGLLIATVILLFMSGQMKNTKKSESNTNDK